MRILSFVTHTPHQYDLANALYDCQFDLIGDNWNTQQRPIPPNVNFVEGAVGKYDLAIGHVGGETEAIIPFSFKNLSIILICHGAGEPFISGNINSPYNASQIAKSCNDYKVVCCCEREAKEWKKAGMKNNTYIWHGMKEIDFKQCQYDTIKPIIVNSGGWDYMNNVPLIEELHNRGVTWLQKDLQIGNFEEYLNTLSWYNVYISATRYSSFPRSRAEAMHSGMCIITTKNWDEDKFIKDGTNGFLVGNSADEIIAKLKSLDLKTIKRVGLEGQITARDKFGLQQYRKRWLEVIRSVI
jgi:hypothetical protein